MVVRPGQRVGKYVLGERIAQGGMAEVWGARVEGPEGFVKPVAMKFILENFSGDTEFERLFVNEARVAARLQHANLVSIFDFDKIPAQNGEAGRYYIAMERVDGHDLRRVYQSAEEQGKPFSHQLCLHVAGEVLKGLRYVHERKDPEKGTPLGLIHRDVSPHNVLVGMGGEVKLSDFGIAKAMTQSLGTQSGMIRGKLSYASPEQLRAEGVDHRTDQFALGIALWEMLTHRRLFDGNDEVEIIGKVLRCEIPRMAETPVGPVPAEVEAIVRRMLAPSKDDRYPTTAAALSAVLSAPGYTHDGTILSDVMHQLFPETGSMAMHATVRMDGASGDGGTPSPLTPAPSGNVRSEVGKSTRTITGGDLNPSASGPYASGDRGYGSPGGASRRTSAARRDPVTGSSYVSGYNDLSLVLPKQRSPWPWVIGMVASAGVVTGGLLMFQPWQARSTRALPAVTAPARPSENGSPGHSEAPKPVLDTEPGPIRAPLGKAPEAGAPAHREADTEGEAGVAAGQTEKPSGVRASAAKSARQDASKRERAKGRHKGAGEGAEAVVGKGAVAVAPVAASPPPNKTEPPARTENPPRTEPPVQPRGPSSNNAPIIP